MKKENYPQLKLPLGIHIIATLILLIGTVLLLLLFLMIVSNKSSISLGVRIFLTFLSLLFISVSIGLFRRNKIAYITSFLIGVFFIIVVFVEEMLFYLIPAGLFIIIYLLFNKKSKEIFFKNNLPEIKTFIKPERLFNR